MLDDVFARDADGVLWFHAARTDPVPDLTSLLVTLADRVDAPTLAGLAAAMSSSMTAISCRSYTKSPAADHRDGQGLPRARQKPTLFLSASLVEFWRRSARMPALPREQFVRAAVIVGCAVAGLVHAAAVRELFAAGGLQTVLAWSPTIDESGLSVKAVTPGGEAEGKLRAGDRIVAINGFPPIGHGGLGGVAFMDLRDGDPYLLRVVRGEQTVDVPLVHREQQDPSTLWLLQVPLLIIALSFLVSGTAVGYLRPGEPVARRYAAWAILVAIVLIPFGVFAGEYSRGFARAVFATARVGSPIMLATAYHFFKAFPPGIPTGGVWRWLGAVLSAWSIVLLGGAIATAIAISGTAADAMRQLTGGGAWFAAYDLVSSVFILAAFSAVVAVIVRNHIVVSDPNQRRRLRWVLWGSLAGTFPLLCAFAWDAVYQSVTGQPIDFPLWLRVQGISALFLVFLPVTFSYAVVRHRVIGVEVVIRKSAQYLLARNVLRVAVGLPVVLLIARAVSNPDKTLAALVLERPAFVVLTVASAMALLLRTRLSNWLDRRFFRDAANRDRILLDLIARIGAGPDAPGEVALTVTDGIDRALHPRSVHVCRSGQETTLQDAAAGTDNTTSAVDVPPPELLRRVREATEPLDVATAAATLTAEERAWLGRHQAHLAVPIIGGPGRLWGLLLVGEKRSEEPYTSDERKLLKNVADQIGRTWDNAALRTQVASAEQQRHDVFARIDAGINLFKECPQCGRCYDRSQDRCEADGAALAHTLAIEREIQGRYRLDAAIGRGGMGVVYAATDLRLQRTVAIKLLKNPAGDPAESRRRFEMEARALARLHHPNIVAIHDTGSVGVEIAFLVMEHLRGETLRQQLRRAGPMSPGVVSDWLAPVLAAIASAHATGVVHRDVKPENLFFAAGPNGLTPKVLDFGVAKLVASDLATATALTDAGKVVGTLAYMSPEQLMGWPVSGSTDIFSLGVTVVEALTGEHPFQRGDASSTVTALLHESMRLAGDTDEVNNLDRVLQRALAKNALDRYESVDLMAEELLPALRACAPTARCRLVRERR